MTGTRADRTRDGSSFVHEDTAASMRSRVDNRGPNRFRERLSKLTFRIRLSRTHDNITPK